jgi:hypothetical protein
VQANLSVKHLIVRLTIEQLKKESEIKMIHETVRQRIPSQILYKEELKAINKEYKNT